MDEEWGINDPVVGEDDSETWGENDPVVENAQEDWGANDPVVGEAEEGPTTTPSILQQYDEAAKNYKEKSTALQSAMDGYKTLAESPERTPEQEVEMTNQWQSMIRTQAALVDDTSKLQELQPAYDKYFADQKQARIDYIEDRRGSGIFGDEGADALYELDARAEQEYGAARSIEDDQKRKEAVAAIQAKYQAEEKTLNNQLVERFKEGETKINNAADVIGQAVASGQTIDQFLLETNADVEEYAELRDSLLNQDDPEKGKLYREALTMLDLARGQRVKEGPADTWKFGTEDGTGRGEAARVGIVNNEIRVSPLHVWDAEGIKSEIEALDISDAKKQKTIASIPQLQEEAAKVELPFLQQVKEFNSFVKENRLENVSPKRQIAEWKSREEGWLDYIGKAPAQVGIGLTTGTLGLIEAGQAIVGATALTMGAQNFADPFLDSATKTSDEVQRLTRISQEIGGPTFAAELAAVVPQIVTQIGFGGAVGFGGSKIGLKPKTVSNIGFGSSVGVAFAQSYGGVLSSAFQQLEKEKIDGGMDPVRARAEAVKEAQLPAALSGLSTAIVTTLGGKRGAEAVFRQGADGIKAKLNTAAFRAELDAFIPNVVKGFRNEGYEEFADQLAQGIIEQATFNPELATSDIVNNAFKALVIGGITGGTIEGLKYGYDYMRAPSQMARREESMASMRQSISNVEREISEAAASSPIGGEFQREYDATQPSDQAAALGARSVDRTRMTALQEERKQLTELLEDETISRVARNQLEAKLAAADFEYYSEILVPSRINVVNEQIVDQLDAMAVTQQTKDSVTALAKIANGLGAESLTGRERVAVGITSIGEGRFIASKKNPMIEVTDQGVAKVTEAGRLMAENIGVVPLVRMIGLSETTQAKRAEMQRMAEQVAAQKAQTEAKEAAESDEAKRYGPESAEALKRQAEAQPPAGDKDAQARMAQLLREQEEQKRKGEEAVAKAIEGKFLESFRPALSEVLIPTAERAATVDLNNFREALDSIATFIDEGKFTINVLDESQFKVILPESAYEVVVEAFKQNPQRALNALRAFGDEVENAIKEFGGGAAGAMEEPPEVAPLRRVARAEQTPEDVKALSDAGLVEIYKDQPVITEAGIAALPEAERPRLSPEARKIQIDTGASSVVSEAISKNLRIGVDQVGPNVKMPEGWTLDGDIYVPPQKQEVEKAEEPPVAPPVQPPVAPPTTPPLAPPPTAPPAGALTEEQANSAIKAAERERARKPPVDVKGRTAYGPQSVSPKLVIGKTARAALLNVSRINLSKIAQSNPNEIMMQDIAAILAELNMPILDAEKVITLSSIRKRGRARRVRLSDGTTAIAMPSTLKGSARLFVHEVGHTITADEIGKYAPRKKTGRGKDYFDALNKAIANPKTPDPVKRLFTLYISTIDQLGITEQYFGANGIAGTPDADTSTAMAKRMQATGALRSDLDYDTRYGLANVEEFVSQTFSRPTFRELLKTLKDPTQPSRTMWSAFVEAIQRILQLPKESMAAGVIEASVDIGMITTPSRAQGRAAPTPATEGDMAPMGKPEEGKTVEMSLEMEKERTFQLLGERLYTAELPKVVVKETTQNAFDAIKDAEETGEIPKGSGVIGYSRKELEVNGQKIVRMMFTDNGGGMTPEILQNAFFTVGGTFKRSGKGSGGFGLAKLGMFMSADRVMVETVRDGVVTKADLTKQELVDKKFNVNVAEDPSRQNGTMVILEFKKSITRSDGKTVEFENPYTVFDRLIHHDLTIIDDNYGSYQNELIGLFQNESSGLWTLDEIKKSQGKKPYTFEDFVKDAPNVETFEQDFVIAGAKKPIKVRVASSRLGLKRKDGKAKWNEDFQIAGATRNLKNHNMSVYSNGLFQFEKENLKIDPLKLWGGDPLPYNIVVDIDAGGLDAASLAYPFTNSREDFQNGVVKDYINNLLNDIRIKERQRQFDQEFNLLTDISGGKPRKDSPTLYNNTTIVPEPFEQKFLEDLSKTVFDVADDLVVALRKGNEDNILEDTWYKVKSQKGSVAPTGKSEEDSLDYFYGVGISKNWGGVNTSRDPVSVLVNPIYEERVDEYARTEFGRRMLARTIAKTLIHEINHHLHRNEGSDFTFFILQNEAYLGEVGAIQSAVDKILPIVNQHPDAIISLKNKFRTAETKDTDNELTGEQYERSSKEPDGQPRTTVVGGNRLVQQPSTEVSPRPTSEEDGEQTGAYLPSSLTAGGRQDAGVGEGISFGEALSSSLVGNQAQITEGGVSRVEGVEPAPEPEVREATQKHLDAVANNNTEEAQRLTDEVAKIRNYNSENLLFHGTTHIFNVFTKDRANVENDFGKGYYLTNTEADAEINYAGEGPDLTSRIERLSEQLEDNENLTKAEALKKAKEILSGGGQRIMRVYVKLENPFNIGGPNETFLDYNLPYDETIEEYGEPTGALVEFVDQLRAIIERYSEDSSVDADKAVGNILEYAMDRDGISASDLVRILKKEDSGIVYATDENGDSATSEIIREAIEATGFDGIVDSLVNQKFGKSQKKLFGMKGMGPDTVHTIVFDSSQIKSADAVTRDDQGNVIPLSERFMAEEEDVRYAPDEEFEIIPEQVEDQVEGTPEASTIKVMGEAFNMANEQSAAEGTSEGTLPLQTITNAWMNSGRDVRDLENSIIRYTNLSPEVAATLADAISKQLDIQRGIAEVSNMASKKKEEEPEYRPFSFGKRIADELPAYMQDKMNRAYEVLRNDVSIEEANRVMQSMTVEEAMLATMKMDNGVSMGVRSMMAQIVLRKIMDKRASTKGKRRDEYRATVAAHVDFVDWINEYLMEMGQGIQAFSRFSDLGADGILLKVRKDINKAINKHITNRKKDIDQIKKDVEDGDSAAFDATLKANNGNIDKAADNAAQQEAKKMTIEEQAQKLAQKAAQKVAGGVVRPRKTDPLSELVNGHLRKYNKDFLAEARALGVSPETAQKIEESAIKLRDSRVAAKSEKERFKAMQEERMRVKRELARENKYIYGRRPTIWEDYQDMFSERLARRLMRDPKKKIPPSLLLFTDRLTENLLGFVPEAERQASTPKSFQAMIEDALNNRERYEEAFNRALEDISLKIGELEVRMEMGEKLADQYKKALAAQEFLQRLAPQIQDFPVSDKLIMRFVGQKAKAAKISIVSKYNEWYRSSRTQRKKLEQELAEGLVSDVNISDADAIKLARSIVKDFTAKAEERRERALARFKKPKEKSKRLAESPLKKFFELVNMGAMTDQEAYEVMAHRFELPTWDEKFAEKIENMALELQDMPEGNARRKMTQNLMAEIARRKGFSLADLGAGFAYSNMLSDFETFLINLKDTLINNFANGFANSVADGDWSRMKGIVQGYRKGWREATYTFKTGLRINMPRLEEKTPLTVELVKYGKKGGVPLEDTNGMNAIAKTILESYPAKVLNAWRYVTRIMEATDAFNYTASAEGQRYAEAAKMAKDEGLTGKARDKRVNEILNLGDDKYQAALKQAEQEGYTGADAKLRAIEIQDSGLDPEMRERSFERALTDVYRNMPKGIAGYMAARFDRWIMGWENPWIRNSLKLMSAPFVITPTNLFNKWLDWSPYGYKRLFWGSGNFFDKDGPYYLAPPKVGSGDFYAQAFKASSSVLVMGLVGGLIKAGLLELIGRGPSDEEERKDWTDRGNRPYTFRFMNGPAITFAYTPWALMLSAMANVSNWEKYNKKEDASFVDRSYLAFLETVGVVMELPFFSGPADLIDALIVKNNENFVRATNRFVESKYAMVFPNFVRKIDTILDPAVYDTEGIRGLILDKVPFARRFGTQRLNMFGEPIGGDKPIIDRFIGRTIVTEKPSRESRILAKYDAYPYMPNPREAKALVDGEKAQMTEEQYNEYARGAGQEFKKWLNTNYDPDAEVSERALERGKERIHKRLSEIRARWVRKVSTY